EEVELDELEPVEPVKAEEESTDEIVPESEEAEENIKEEAEPEKVVEEELPVYAETVKDEAEEVAEEKTEEASETIAAAPTTEDTNIEETSEEEVAEYAPILIPAKEDKKEDVVIETSAVEDEPEVEIIADDITDDDETEKTSEGFRPIVLVPVESNPPEHHVKKDIDKEEEDSGKIKESKDNEIKIAELPPVEEKKSDDDIIIPYIPAPEENVNKGKAKKDSKKKEETKEIIIPVIPEVKKIEPRPAAVEPKAEEASDFISSHLVASLKELKSGSYYVQIATLDDKENMKNIIDTYGKKYPVVFVPRSSGKSYQVLIGPLNVDEYGSVLQRFKARGYKDAFMRKIK
nr:SPOR domain-containing protein [Treponema sp.]